MRRAGFALAAVLFLAGCDMWGGPPHYAPSEGSFPFTPGTYRISGNDGKPQVVRWDGRHFFLHGKRATAKDEADIRALTIVPMPFVGRRIFILQDGVDDEALYGFIEQRGDRYIVNFPSCSATRTIVQDAGGTLDTNIWENVADAVPKEGIPVTELATKTQRPNCVFPTRASFEKAARRYITERQLIPLIRIERIAD